MSRINPPCPLVSDNERVVAEDWYVAWGDGSCGRFVMPVENDLVVQQRKLRGDVVHSAFLVSGQVLGCSGKRNAQGVVAETAGDVPRCHWRTIGGPVFRRFPIKVEVKKRFCWKVCEKFGVGGITVILPT